MNRKTSALFAFTWPVAVFLIAIAVACWLSGAACGADDLADLTAQLEAQNAAAKPHGHADPFAPKNACGCHCRGDQCHHDCEGVCNDIDCPFRPIIDAPKIGDTRDSGDPLNPWVFEDGAKGLWWYKYATPPARQATYYAPPPAYYQAPLPFFGGGGGNCGPRGG